MATTRLIVARHGNTFGPGDVVTRVGGKTDLALVDSGLEQGRLIGRWLKRENMIPDMIFTSNLKRTSQTAEQAQGEMGTQMQTQSLTIFNEIDYGPDENQPEDKVVARLGEEALKKWDAEGVVPNGWNVDPQAIVANWKSFAADLKTQQAGKTVMVVTSNGIARFAPHLTGDFDAFRAKHAIKISTGALCIFENDGTSENWICTHWNLKPKQELTETQSAAA
jgi:2,3-bisphosphoglycerate-dependent phosphoglycerate mutase